MATMTSLPIRTSRSAVARCSRDAAGPEGSSSEPVNQDSTSLSKNRWHSTIRSSEGRSLSPSIASSKAARSILDGRILNFISAGSSSVIELYTRPLRTLACPSKPWLSIASRALSRSNWSVVIRCCPSITEYRVIAPGNTSVFLTTIAPRKCVPAEPLSASPSVSRSKRSATRLTSSQGATIGRSHSTRMASGMQESRRGFRRRTCS